MHPLPVSMQQSDGSSEAWDDAIVEHEFESLEVHHCVGDHSLVRAICVYLGMIVSSPPEQVLL